MAEPVILVQDLRKSYGSVEAVRGIDFEVARGEVFGLLGPNGAGKTSTVEILEGLRPRTSGQVKVLGFDPGADTRALKDRIGVCLQQTTLPEKLRVVEALEWFGGFYSRTADPGKILDRLQLNEKRNAFYGTLSGGQKQRVAIALALINDPSIVFFDEPTTGLDPQVRLEIHGLIQQLRDDQRSIILTTHYIEEAERLCDRVAIVDEGKIVAVGTPKQILESTMGESRVEIRTGSAFPEVPALDGLAHQLSEDRRSLTVWTPRPARTIADLVKWVDAGALGLEDIHLKRPSLEDAFIKLTGKSLRD